MAESYGPRTYLVGQVLPALLALADFKNGKDTPEKVVADAIRIVDMTLDAMAKRRAGAFLRSVL